MSRDITGTVEYQQGTNVERKVVGWLITAYGCVCIRVRHGGDVAPTLRAWNRQLILPDLQVMGPRQMPSWLEVKSKTTCGYYEVAHMWTTGIDFANWDHYCNVERVTGRPVFIVFCHREQNEVRIVRATDPAPDDTSRPHSFSGSGAGGGMRYWDWEKLRLLATFDEVMEAPSRFCEHPETPLFGPDDAEQVSLPGLEAA